MRCMIDALPDLKPKPNRCQNRPTLHQPADPYLGAEAIRSTPAITAKAMDEAEYPVPARNQGPRWRR